MIMIPIESIRCATCGKKIENPQNDGVGFVCPKCGAHTKIIITSGGRSENHVYEGFGGNGGGLT